LIRELKANFTDAFSLDPALFPGGAETDYKQRAQMKTPRFSSGGARERYRRVMTEHLPGFETEFSDMRQDTGW
jgi:hypothetical protein